MINFLVRDIGFDVDGRDEGGDTVLYIAIREGCIDSAKILLNLGASMDIRDSTGQDSYKIAISYG